MRTPAAHPDRLTAEERRELDDDAFGIPSRREFPLVDAAHVRAAESYFRYAPEADKPALARRILRQAAEFGIEIRSETILRWAAGPQSGNGRQLKKTYLCKKRCT